MDRQGEVRYSVSGTTKFTEKAQDAIVAAQRDTEARNISQLEPIALLVALLNQSDGLIPQSLRKLQVDVDQLRNQATAEF